MSPVPINASPLFIQNRLWIIESERAFNLFKCQLLHWPGIEEQLFSVVFFIARDCLVELFGQSIIKVSHHHWWMETILIWSLHFNQLIIAQNCLKSLSGASPPPARSLIFSLSPPDQWSGPRLRWGLIINSGSLRISKFLKALDWAPVRVK